MLGKVNVLSDVAILEKSSIHSLVELAKLNNQSAWYSVYRSAVICINASNDGPLDTTTPQEFQVPSPSHQLRYSVPPLVSVVVASAAWI